jgi:AcrR family transcriptional regulator
VALLQRDGADAFSVRRLAAELGVDAMALYKHVANKDDLLGAALARVFENARPLADGQWWDQAAGTFREHRRVVRAHPWVLALLLHHTVRSGEPWEGVDQTLGLLQQHLGVAGAARWMRLLAAFTNGFLLTEQEVVGTADTSEVERAHPDVVAAAERGLLTGDADFESGLAVLVAAMRAQAVPTRRRAR